ncbi:hypothetical protein [Parasegetibacter sp. NRK P23]|uniref:hypothetical protein n=1 Tax=Parasegetibacter sp. NRK P23 TaxID=2942999 RepID=UPI002043C5F7|nr:hypothetical protein [Parasegetibacter sp. NRK P23]MCM5530254.1 hypothetical protein [Parasegetibacter sp. NRK P23]
MLKKFYSFFKRKKKIESVDYFVAVSDLLFYSIKNQNEKLAKTIASFMYDTFKKFRDQHHGNEIEYPIAYYELVSKTIEELAIQRNRRFTFLEHRTAGSVWLLGEFTDSKISEATYRRIWNNFILALKYERDDYIIYHWEHAFQYASYSLKPISLEHSEKPPFDVLNQEEIDQRKKERDRFLEFHYALGGLLLYKSRYKCIQRAFQYTQSIPPRYELLPETMSEVFRLYFYFRDPYEMRIPWINQRYYFPETGGINSDAILKSWICKYIAVLFLRQYTIVSYLVYMKPLEYPVLPKKQSEKREWIDNLDYFKKLVDDILKNKELLDTLGFSFISDEWCEENNYPKPLEFIEKVKQDTIASYEGTLINQPVSDVKVEKFKNTTANILSPLLDKYEAINNNENLTGDLTKWYVNGQSHIIDKSGLADDQDADHINFDSFLPESFSNKLKEEIPEIFFRVTTQRYLLNEHDIIPAISGLNISVDDYIIVSFGVEIKKLIEESKLEFLNKIEVIEFGFRNYHLVGDSIFILNKKHLPKLKYNNIPDDEIQKYSLKEAIRKYNVYISVVDLNLASELRDTLEESSDGKDLRKSVYMAIFIHLEVQWQKDLSCIQIQKVSAYRERGIPNNLSDIKPIDEKPSR